MCVSRSGRVSLIADHMAGVKLTMPNFSSYDAEGNLYVSNFSGAPTLEFAVDGNLSITLSAKVGGSHTLQSIAHQGVNMAPIHQIIKVDMPPDGGIC